MGKRYAAWAARRRVALGFALGIAYLIFAQPTPGLLVQGGMIALVGVGVRAFAAGYLDKNQSLTTGGPYRYTQNPLYLGSFLIGLGFVLAGGSLPLGLAFLGFFLLVYWPVMRREGDHLRVQFGEAHFHYVERVPLFFPTWRGAPASDVHFQWSRYRRNREYEAMLGYIAGMIFLAVKMGLQ